MSFQTPGQYGGYRPPQRPGRVRVGSQRSQKRVLWIIGAVVAGLVLLCSCGGMLMLMSVDDDSYAPSSPSVTSTYNYQGGGNNQNSGQTCYEIWGCVDGDQFANDNPGSGADAGGGGQVNCGFIKNQISYLKRSIAQDEKLIDGGTLSQTTENNMRTALAGKRTTLDRYERQLAQYC